MNISHEVLSRDEAAQLCKVDSILLWPNGVFSKDYIPGNPDTYDLYLKRRDKYVRENTLTYYIAVNTWCMMVRDCDRWAASALLDYINRYGLLTAIRECDEAAFQLVKGEDVTSDLAGMLIRATSGSGKEYFALNEEKNVFRSDFATSLQLLRYLKRFSPSAYPMIQDEGIEKFLQNENRTKLLQRREYPDWLIKAVKDEISSILDWDSILKDINKLDVFDFEIPSGTTYEGYKTLREKVAAIFSQHPECAYQPFGLPYIYPMYAPDTDSDTSRVQAVPKSYKASRIIAMEPIYRQARANKVMSIIKRYLPDVIDITDQTRNQELAWVGSVYGELATLDASNASDLISKTLFRSVIPAEIVNVIDPLFSHYTLVDGTRRQMQMMSTAGHSLTFIFETIIYYGIAAAACAYVSTFTGQHLRAPSVYGDDVVIPTVAAQTAIEFYSMLGLKINVDKSFISGKYRESCGEEYYNGINLTTVYYPRFPVIGKCSSKSIDFGVRMYRDSYRGKIDDSTTMLVDLQKRLYGISYDASLFVWEIIREARPRITSSKFGAICNDLWAAVDMGLPYNTTECRDVDRGLPSKDVMDHCVTRKHSYASIRYKADNIDKWISASDRNFDIFKYQNFLKNGPSYSDPLLELLGISDPPISLDDYIGKGVLVWRYNIE